jgi:hypothetical protein
MTTMHLSANETSSYRGTVRADIRFRTAEMAYVMGRRFYQVVGSNGRILDVGEVSLSLDISSK